MDPMVMQILTAFVIDLVAVPLFGLILNRVVTKRLDAFDRKRDEARQERKERFERDEKWQESMTGGVRSILRSELMESHAKWMNLGYCPIDAKESISKNYSSYHDLGGNGLGTAIYDELMALPTHPHDTAHHTEQ